MWISYKRCVVKEAVSHSWEEGEEGVFETHLGNAEDVHEEQITLFVYFATINEQLVQQQTITVLCKHEWVNEWNKTKKY